MSDFNPGPPYRGDPGVPHANENNFTVRASAGRGVGAHSRAFSATQAFMGGLWVVLGLQFCKDVVEVRPLHRRAPLPSASTQRAACGCKHARIFRVRPQRCNEAGHAAASAQRLARRGSSCRVAL